MKGSKEGVILIGDAWNMRHPLTGGSIIPLHSRFESGLRLSLIRTGGMTVALSDAVILTSLLRPYLSAPLSSPAESPIPHDLTDLLNDFHWQRKPLSSTINILSVALYDLFSADGK
jgi:squalene monooxygenase